jgi:alpha-L-rhamnosidase
MSDLTVLPITVEHHREPLGIGESAPRISWVSRTDLPDWRQAAYELEIEPEDGEAWSSGRVDTAESVLVPWGAPPLTSRERRTVRVRVWGEGAAEPSAWSEDVVVEAGLLDPAEWSAALVQPVLPDEHEEPVLLLRREFVIDRPVVGARLYATAQGVYEAELNGAVVGDHVLAPGWTAYQHRLRYQTYDVTALLTEGPNAIGVSLADGWYRGYVGFAGKKEVYGDRLGAFVQLEVEHPDGSWTVVVSDGSWRSTLGPVTRAGFYSGESDDLRVALPPGRPSSWAPWTSRRWSPRPGHRCGAPRCSRRWTSRRRRRGRHSWTSARTSSAGCGSSCPTPRRAPRSPSGTPRSWSTASWAPGRCARRRRRTSSSWTATARARGSRASPSTASGTPR